MSTAPTRTVRTLLPLETRGLVVRQPDPRDARVGYAALTKTEKPLLANALISAESIYQEATQMAPGDQIDSFSLLLGQLAGINLSNV